MQVMAAATEDLAEQAAVIAEVVEEQVDTLVQVATAEMAQVPHMVELQGQVAVVAVVVQPNFAYRLAQVEEWEY
jgi:hypothetical protein